jgi:tetratricopeptide (TPR) repeat protein
MASIIQGYEYDIFISYRQKDNKHGGWVTKFVDELKGELEATFKETVSVYFDENPHDRLQETHHVAKSLEAKLKCVIFIPILSQTYCDTSSYAWQFELLPFNKMAAEDSFGKEIKLRGGNYASRILPVRIHDLESEDIELFQQETGSVLRAMDFVFKTAQGVNRPLKPDDNPEKNLNGTFYRDQINKVAHAIKEIILGMKSGADKKPKEETVHKIQAERVMEKFNLAKKAKNGNKSGQKILSGVFIALALILAGLFLYPELINGNRLEMLRKKGQVSVAVMPFQNLSRDPARDFWEVMIQDNLINSLSREKDLKVRQMQSVLSLLQSPDQTNFASLTPALARNISQKLDANVFVQGSINQIGDITRLNAKIIDSKTEEVFQSFQLDGHHGNIIQLSDSLTQLIRNHLIISILEKELTPVFQLYFEKGSKAPDPEAFRLFFTGMKIFFEGNYPEARKRFLMAMEIEPDYFAPLSQMPNAYGNEGNITEAKRWTLILMEKKDKLSKIENAWASSVYALYFETPLERIQSLKQGMEVDDQLPVFYSELGNAYNNIYQYDNAIWAYEKNLEIFKKWGTKPDWSFHYTGLGFAYHKTGQYRKEQKLYKKAEKDFPGDPSVIRRQAILALVQGKTKQADEYLARYESLIRNEGLTDALILARLGFIYEEAAMYHKAEEYLRNALLVDPENPFRLNSLATLLIRHDLNINEGLELVEKVLEIRPDNFVVLYTKGLGLYKQGQYREALELLQNSWDKRREQAVYNHEAFLDLERAKKAVAKL